MSIWGALVQSKARLAAFAGLGQACRAGCDQGKQKRTAALAVGLQACLQGVARHRPRLIANCCRPALRAPSQVDEGRRRLQQLLDRGAFNGARCPPASGSGGGGGNGGGMEADCASGSGSGSGSGDVSDRDLSSGAAGGDGGGSTGGNGSGGDAAAVPWDTLFQLLSDDRRLEEDPARLPDTGYGHEFEAAVSGIFVQVGVMLLLLT